MSPFEYKCGMLFGSFDPLHAGHVRLICRAIELCEEIVVIVDDDEIIRKVKHREPLFPLNERRWDLYAIKGVEYVEVESIETPKRIWVKMYKPDILIKGDDWKGKAWDGADLGVPVLYLPYTQGITSTMFHKARK